MKKVEKHKIRKINKYFPFILEQLEQCKKISNSATFIIRQNFFFNKIKDNKGNEVRKYIKYNDMNRIFKRDRTELYRSLIYVQSVQQILRKVHSSFDSFFKAIKDYKKNKSNYTGRPKLPKYKSSKYDELIITNQNFKQNDKVLNFKGYLKELSFTMYNKGKANQVMFKYNGVDIDVYIIYDDGKTLISKEVVDYIEDDSRIISIDLGLNNLVTITNNIGIRSVIINGKGLKSKNIYYNYQIGKYQSILATVNEKDKEKKSYKSNRLTRLRVKRNNIMNDYIHKTTRYIINYCKENNIDNIEFICGKVENEIKKLTKKAKSPDIIVLDPARKGCDPIVLDTILSVSPRKIIYISCNTSTLARDLKILLENAKYTLEEVTPFDLFCHSCAIPHLIISSCKKYNICFCIFYFYTFFLSIWIKFYSRSISILKINCSLCHHWNHLIFYKSPKI